MFINIVIDLIFFSAGFHIQFHCGSLTPTHDGSQTPNASSAWDSSVSITYPSYAYNQGYQMNSPVSSPTPGTLINCNYNPCQDNLEFQSK